jgi:hydrogenase/urease accessory protein HupE
VSIARAVAALLAAALLVLSVRAEGHPIGLSKGEYRAGVDGLTVELTLARPEASGAVAGLDADDDGAIDEEELAGAARALEPMFVGSLRVERGGEPCTGRMTDRLLTEQDGLRMLITYRCPASAGSLAVSLDFIDSLSHGHRHAAHIVSGALGRDEVFAKGRLSFEVPPPSPTTTDSIEKETFPAVSSLPFLRMGFEHILVGVDHLVFLVALILVGGRLRATALVVTAFTVAHSLTLALSVLGVFALSSRLVEPAIALSVAYVGAENLFIKEIDKRWRLTFFFGLVHGCAFASALSEVAIPRSNIAGALFMFNAGVELGQIAIMALLLPVVFALRRIDGFARRVVPALSLLIVLVGLGWFVERVGGGVTADAGAVIRSVSSLAIARGGRRVG